MFRTTQPGFRLTENPKADRPVPPLVRPLDARGIRIGAFLHAGVALGASTGLARGSGFFDALGLLLLAAATTGYVTARVATADVDGAHTAFVGGGIGGLLVSTVFVVGVRADATTGVFWRFHHALATAGLPGWLVADHGQLVVLVAGLLLGAVYAFATLAGGAIAIGDILTLESPDDPANPP